MATSTIVLAGTATDADLGNNGISSVSVNSQTATGGTVAGAGMALWTQTVALKLGPNVLSIVARDNSPNHNSAALTITIVYEPVDLTPPDLAVTSHKDGQTVSSSSITLEGTATNVWLEKSSVRDPPRISVTVYVCRRVSPSEPGPSRAVIPGSSW